MRGNRRRGRDSFLLPLVSRSAAVQSRNASLTANDDGAILKPLEPLLLRFGNRSSATSRASLALRSFSLNRLDTSLPFSVQYASQNQSYAFRLPRAASDAIDSFRFSGHRPPQVHCPPPMRHAPEAIATPHLDQTHPRSHHPYAL